MFMGPWDQGGPWSPTGIGGVHPVPQPRLGAGARPALPGAGRSRSGDAAGRPGRGRRTRRAACRRAPDAARRHRRLRGLPLQHDGREADGAVEHPVPLPRARRSPGGEEWDEAIRLLLLMLAPAAPHITEELWSRRLAARGEDVVARSTPRRGRWWTLGRRRRSPRARSRSRSTARSATGSSCRPTPTPGRSKQPCWRRRGSRQVLGGRQPDRIIHAGGGRLVNLVVREPS